MRGWKIMTTTGTFVCNASVGLCSRWWWLCVLRPLLHPQYELFVWMMYILWESKTVGNSIWGGRPGWFSYYFHSRYSAGLPNRLEWCRNPGSRAQSTFLRKRYKAMRQCKQYFNFSHYLPLFWRLIFVHGTLRAAYLHFERDFMQFFAITHVK